jgi:hypothetical protein
MNKKNAQPLPRNWQILSTSPLLPLLSNRANNPPPGTKRFMTTCLLTRHPYEDMIKSADSAKMVELINHILKAPPTWTPEDALYKSHDTRVMNMLFCAAGGPSTFRYPMCPETNVEETHLVGNKKHHRTLFSCDAKLCHLKPQERIEYLNTLYDGLKHHLTNQGLSSELSGMIKKLEGKETDEIRTSLRPLYHFLLRELQKGIH